MTHWQCRWALPWAMLLLLLGFQLLVTHRWNSQEEKDSDTESHFPATVEYALHIFNLQSKDMKAYRLVRILNSWKDQVEDDLAFSMELELRRTEHGKFDEDIDNCPFQESSELNNTFNCFFTISTVPWGTPFYLLYKTCLEGFHRMIPYLAWL
ncbi:cystatin-9-like [Callorhinus ursinus]|uniref:Cystatin-9-like n=1 Tax=Callorhinus ursinus TaxID=34884 RepID=A0A3Q7PG92_CALUR|nr:cystatin-9-like [Callorhinus ursinus]